MGCLATLVVLEIVLGIDSLVFYCNFGEKNFTRTTLDKARIIGLLLALWQASGVTGIHCMGGDINRTIIPSL